MKQNKKNIALTKLKKYVNKEKINLREDTFKIVSKWYHMSIIELCHIKSSKSCHEWIAKATLKIASIIFPCNYFN